MGVYLHDWSADKFHQMVMDFEGVYCSKANYESDASAHINAEYWAEKRAQAKAALVRYQDVDVLLASYCGNLYAEELGRVLDRLA